MSFFADKASPERSHADSRAEIVVVMAKAQIEFIEEAIEVGFTQTQAEFMAKHLSLSGHIHEYYYDQHDHFTKGEVKSTTRS